MSIRLIYHTDESTAGGISPFDEALMTMTSEQDILIACPYLDIGFLNRYIGHSRSWYLLTDVQAWLNAYPSTKHEEIQAFIEEHAGRIHHLPALHAKAVITKTTAFFGSANLTEPGILRNQEISAVVEDGPSVEVLYAWFKRLWSQTEPADRNEVEVYAREVRQTTPAPPRKPRYSISSPAPRVRAKRADHGRKPEQIDAAQPALAPPMQPTPVPLVRKRRGRKLGPQGFERRCSKCGLTPNDVYPEGHERAGQPVKFWGKDYYCSYDRRQAQKKTLATNSGTREKHNARSAKYLSERPHILQRAQKRNQERMRQERIERRTAEHAALVVEFGEVLDLKEAADMLNMSRQNVHLLIQQQVLEPIKRPRGTRVRLWLRRADVERLKAERDQQGEQQIGDQQDAIL